MDPGLVLLSIVMHVVAILAGVVLLVLAVQGGEQPGPPGGGADDGGEPRREPPQQPTGGLPIGPPLPSADPARVRVRQPMRLGELRRRHRRRGPREPQRPARVNDPRRVSNRKEHA